jgi:enoyl-CoA hydratase/carnithine racemase
MSNIICQTRGHVLLIGLNRPEKRNAVTPDMYYDMALMTSIGLRLPNSSNFS